MRDLRRGSRVLAILRIPRHMVKQRIQQRVASASAPLKKVQTQKAEKNMATMHRPAQLDHDQLHPYASFQLFERTGRTAFDLRNLAADLARDLEASVADLRVQCQSELPVGKHLGGWAIHFSRTTQAAWTNDPAVLNIEQHVLVLVSKGRVLGVSTSAAELRGRVSAHLSALATLRPMAADALEALMRSGQLRALWLTGIHRKSPFKADSKVLTGPNLQTALNPLDDRTFKASSGRTETGLSRNSGISRVGVSPKRSYAWIGPTSDLADFVARFRALVEHIAAQRTQPRSPLPVLAQALAQAPASGTVRSAFDFCFVSTETATDLDAETISCLETLGGNVGFVTTGRATDQNFTLNVIDAEHANPNRPQHDWVVDFSVTLADASATAALAADSQAWPRWETFKDLVRDRSLWSVWYESGHSLGGGDWALLDARASSYEGSTTPVDFEAGKWSIKQEKPLIGKAVDWQMIGRDKSLFSWWIQEGMEKCFPEFIRNADPTSFAYCICDDGANELADFILFAKHRAFETPTNPSHLALALIHLKASSSSSPDRDIAPKQYEEVLGQATKNLGRVRFPDALQYVVRRLDRGVAMLWDWSGGRFNLQLQHGARLPQHAPVRTILQSFDGRRHHLHVVVVQPHQRAEALRNAMNQPPVTFRTHMLCTLLCATDGAVRASSGHFSVVMST